MLNKYRRKPEDLRRRQKESKRLCCGHTFHFMMAHVHSVWENRVMLKIGLSGYESYMRRSVQTALLFEAKRCIEQRLPRLRPFQKRALLMTMIFNILREIHFLSPSDKESVLWKTQRSQEQLDPVTAWKRCKVIERDVARLIHQLKSFIHPSRTHQMSVNMLVQDLFVSRIKLCWLVVVRY